MEDNWIKILIFIAIVAYNIYSAARKKKKEAEAKTARQSMPQAFEMPAQPVRSYKAEPETPKEIPVSLEDLMREFGLETEDKKIEEKKAEPRKAPEPVVIPVKKYETVDYDETLEDEDQKVLQKLKKDKEAMAEMRMPRVLKDEHFDPYSSTNKLQENKYAAMLKNPETVKVAFVASEIFKAKHF